jgi:hypothetical protein
MAPPPWTVLGIFPALAAFGAAAAGDSRAPAVGYRTSSDNHSVFNRTALRAIRSKLYLY